MLYGSPGEKRDGEEKRKETTLPGARDERKREKRDNTTRSKSQGKGLGSH